MAPVGYMPDMAGYIMSFCSSHFSLFLLTGQFLGANRSIKAVLGVFLRHFWRNVNHLARPDPNCAPILNKDPLSIGKRLNLLMAFGCQGKYDSHRSGSSCGRSLDY